MNNGMSMKDWQKAIIDERQKEKNHDYAAMTFEELDALCNDYRVQGRKTPMKLRMEWAAKKSAIVNQKPTPSTSSANSSTDCHEINILDD